MKKHPELKYVEPTNYNPKVERNDLININTSYLLANKKFDDVDNDIFQRTVHQAMTNSHIIGCSVKATYDMGKTTNVIEIISKYFVFIIQTNIDK